MKWMYSSIFIECRKNNVHNLFSKFSHSFSEYVNSMLLIRNIKIPSTISLLQQIDIYFRTVFYPDPLSAVKWKSNGKGNLGPFILTNRCMSEWLIIKLNYLKRFAALHTLSWTSISDGWKVEFDVPSESCRDIKIN